MSLNSLIQLYLPAIETALHNSVALAQGEGLNDFHKMMAYHLGWVKDVDASSTGKRIRPLLLLLTTQSAGGNWENALPAAAAVELIHNFSLIHDDIEDNSPIRRGRPTLWIKWGIPLAINAGDAMFTLAHLSMLEINKSTNPQITLDAINILQNTCLNLTKGQHLDILYEEMKNLPVKSYWPMIQGKTASLIAACTEIGALIGNTSKETQSAYRHYGLNLGLAFQALDDILGIWGDSNKIGKSVDSDLVTGKKSLPVLYGLAQNGDFSQRWLSGSISPDEVPDLANCLEMEGAREYTQSEANRLTDTALDELDQANPRGEAGQALKQLTNQLLLREL